MSSIEISFLFVWFVLASNGVFLAAALAGLVPSDRRANRTLALLQVAAAAIVFGQAVRGLGLAARWSQPLALESPLWFLVAPLLYRYVRRTLRVAGAATERLLWIAFALLCAAEAGRRLGGPGSGPSLPWLGWPAGVPVAALLCAGSSSLLILSALAARRLLAGRGREVGGSAEAEPGLRSGMGTWILGLAAVGATGLIGLAATLSDVGHAAPWSRAIVLSMSVAVCGLGWDAVTRARRSTSVERSSSAERPGKEDPGEAEETPAGEDGGPQEGSEVRGAVDLGDPGSVRLAAAIERAMRWEKLYREDLTLEEFARRVGSPGYRVSEVLNRGFGVGFYEYVNRFRVEEAEKLLVAEAERKVGDIGAEVGFQCRASFNRAFKAVTGQTPTAYRGSRA